MVVALLVVNSMRIVAQWTAMYHILHNFAQDTVGSVLVKIAAGAVGCKEALTQTAVRKSLGCQRTSHLMLPRLHCAVKLLAHRGIQAKRT